MKNICRSILVFVLIGVNHSLSAQSTNCVTATSIPLVGTTACVNGTSVGAITDNTLYGGCNVVPVNMVWYTYVTTGSTNVFTVTPGSLTNAEIVIYLGGCPTTGGVLQLCNTAVGSAPVTSTWGIPVGTQVWVGIASNAGNDGTFQFCISSTIPPPTGGQFCATPIILCDENNYTVSSMSQYGSSGQTPSCFANPTQQDMFIEFTVLASGNFCWTCTAANPATEFDWCLWNVTAGCPGTEVCCNYNYGGGSGAGFGQQAQAGTVPCGYNLASFVLSQEFSPPSFLVAGQTYALQISNYNTNSSGFTLAWTNSTCVIQPNANFTINPSGVVCGSSANVTITNSSLGGPQVWNYGDGSPAYTGTNPGTHTYNTAGTYAITCTIGGQCPSTMTQYIQVLDPLTMTSTSNSASCSGCNGTASVTNVTGGDGNYTYSWAPGGQTTTSVANLCAGTYTVTVSNAACASSVSNTITITASAAMNSNITAFADITCFGANNGTATAAPAGGTGPYTYSWNTTPVQTTATATNLPAGTYTCTITDAGGCTSTCTVTIAEPSALTLASTGLSATCNAACDGQLIVIPSGGTQPYSFLWTTGCTNPSCSNVCAGNYTVTVTDVNGCVQTSSTTVTEPTAITTTMSSNTAHCNNNDGDATVVASGGNGGYTYSWAPLGGSAATATNLGPGNYTVTVTDGNNCTQTATVNVANAPGFNIAMISSNNVSCFGACDGAVTISANSGTPPYTYVWSNAVNGASLTNTCAGTYTCTVTDANNCTNTYSITITEPTQLTVNTSANISLCAGANTNLGCVAAGGTPGYTYTWNPGNMNGANPSVTPANTTTYTITVTDANNCTANDSQIVTVNALPVAGLIADTLQGCAPLCVQFTDLSTIANPSAINAWSWDFGDNNTSISQNPNHCYANPGTYTVSLTVTGTGGCTGNIVMNNYINVSGSPNADFVASPQPTDILNPTVFFTDASTGAVNWLWEFHDSANSTSILQNPSFLFPDTGCYNVTLVITNAAGCPDSTTETVCIDPYWTIYIPNAFTPNDDGLNDLFMPFGVGLSPKNYKFYIFDRWGNLIFFTDDLYTGWNGCVKGHSNLCQIDTYVWKLYCTDVLGGHHKYIGKVSLIR